MDILTLFSTFNPAQKELMMALMEQLTGLAKATYGFGVQAKIELESYEGVHTRLELPDVVTLFQLLIYRCFVFRGYGQLREGAFIPIEGITECDNLLPIYTQLLKLLGMIDPSHDDITRQEFIDSIVIPPNTTIKSMGYNFWMLAHFFSNNMAFNPQQFPQIFKYFNSLETRLERELEKEKQFFRELEAIFPDIRDPDDDICIILNSPNPVDVLGQVFLRMPDAQIAAMSPSVKEYIGIPQTYGQGTISAIEEEPQPITPALSSRRELYKTMFQLLRSINDNPDAPITQEQGQFANAYKAAFINALQIFTSDVRSKTPLPIIQRLTLAQRLGFDVDELISHLVLTEQEIHELERHNEQHAGPAEPAPDLPAEVHPDYMDVMFGMNPTGMHRRTSRKRKSKKKRKTRKSRKSRKTRKSRKRNY